MEFLSRNLEETAKIASNFKSKLKPQKGRALVLGLYGDLGSGKTTFVKYLAESFGIKETIQSPTFVIMKSFHPRPAGREGSVFPSFNKLFHIDAYRIEKDEEMLKLGWNEMISDPKNLICIEWPEKIAGIMPSHIVITFEHAGETERKISIT